jgi:predicted glycoside hydrolase/deacetylase ChbG (UPF0249 family)
VRALVVNADDLGYDPEIDRGILEAHRLGIVTSTTAMVGTPFSAEALRAAPPGLGVGLHVVLEGPLDPDGVERAVRAQLDRFETLRGAPPTHLDSHKHRHAEPAALERFAGIARERALPVRALDGAMAARLRAGGVRTPDRFLGDASLRPGWTAETLAAALEGLGEGISELMAHPGFRPRVARTSFGVEREAELAALCAPAVREAIARRGIRLVDYRAVAVAPARDRG